MEKTYKREVAFLLLIFWAVLIVWGIYNPEAKEAFRRTRQGYRACSGVSRLRRWERRRARENGGAPRGSGMNPAYQHTSNTPDRKDNQCLPA